MYWQNLEKDTCKYITLTPGITNILVVALIGIQWRWMKGDCNCRFISTPTKDTLKYRGFISNMHHIFKNNSKLTSHFSKHAKKNSGKLELKKNI